MVRYIRIVVLSERKAPLNSGITYYLWSRAERQLVHHLNLIITILTIIFIYIGPAAERSAICGEGRGGEGREGWAGCCWWMWAAVTKRAHTPSGHYHIIPHLLVIS